MTALSTRWPRNVLSHNLFARSPKKYPSCYRACHGIRSSSIKKLKLAIPRTTRNRGGFICCNQWVVMFQFGARYREQWSTEVGNNAKFSVNACAASRIRSFRNFVNNPRGDSSSPSKRPAVSIGSAQNSNLPSPVPTKLSSTQWKGIFPCGNHRFTISTSCRIL